MSVPSSDQVLNKFWLLPSVSKVSRPAASEWSWKNSFPPTSFITSSTSP